MLSDRDDYGNKFNIKTQCNIDYSLASILIWKQDIFARICNDELQPHAGSNTPPESPWMQISGRVWCCNIDLKEKLHFLNGSQKKLKLEPS